MINSSKLEDFHGTTEAREAVQSGMNVGIGGLTRSTEYPGDRYLDIDELAVRPRESFAETDGSALELEDPGSSNPHYRAWISLHDCHDMTKLSRVAE